MICFSVMRRNLLGVIGSILCSEYASAMALDFEHRWKD